MGQKQSAPSNRPSNAQVGNFCATLGCIIGAIALFLDELTGEYDDSDDKSANSYCGFNERRYVSDSGIAAYYYSYCCDDDTLCSDLSSLIDSITFWDSSDDTQSDYCDTVAAGITWLIFGCVALLLALIAIGAVAFQRENLSKFGELGACICGVIAVAAWYLNNPVCWNDDYVDDEQQRMGWSVALMICASVLWGIGGICSGCC